MTTSFTVSSEGNAGSATTTLNGAIKSIDVGGSNAATNTNYTITLSGSITLNDATDADLLAINLPTGSTLTIIGGTNISLNGNGNQRGLFVYSGTVTVDDLTLTNMQALGGVGGGGAGAGAGLGGGLFVATAGTVILDNVSFTSDKATGGAGGAGGSYNSAKPGTNKYTGGRPVGGGGGLGGNGGIGTPRTNTTGGVTYSGSGGGGGVGLGANGGTGNAGGRGIIPGALSGGSSDFAGGASGGGGWGGRAVAAAA